jgi:transposase, IS30 family
MGGWGGWGRGVPRELRAAVLTRVRAGERPEDVGPEVGVHWGTVYRWLAETGGMPPEWTTRSPLRLSTSEREEIRVGLERGDSFRVVAAALGRAPTTVSREVNNNGGREKYRGCAADRRAHRLARRPKVAKLARWGRLREVVEAGLEQRWSPQQIQARLVEEFPDDEEMRVSHETIYQSLFVQSRGALRRELTACLRSGRTRRRSLSRAAADRRGSIPGMVMISERPAEADDRAVPGHWEGDLVIGANGQSAIATLVERTTRYAMLIALPDGRTAPAVSAALTTATTRLPEHLWRSLTWDQGSEMAGHATFTIITGVPVFFCDPHAPWLRGSNENTNGLIRQYLPKGMDLSDVTQDQLDHIAIELNGRPRKTLAWKTPAEKLEPLVAMTP